MRDFSFMECREVIEVKSCALSYSHNPTPRSTRPLTWQELLECYKNRHPKTMKEMKEFSKRLPK